MYGMHGVSFAKLNLLYSYILILIRDCPFCILRGHWYMLLNYDVFLSMKVVFILGLAQEKV